MFVSIVSLRITDFPCTQKTVTEKAENLQQRLDKTAKAAAETIEKKEKDTAIKTKAFMDTKQAEWGTFVGVFAPGSSPLIISF